MSTAILISGQLRTFAKCYPTQRWHVLRHFEDPHFFITVQDPQAIDDFVMLQREWGEDRVHYQLRTDPDLSAHLTPELTVAYHRAPYTNAAPAHQLLLQHWYQAECWKFFQSARPYTAHVNVDNGESSGEHQSFDTIVRLRADLWFHSFDDEFPNYVVQSDECYLPWWGRFGGHNDRFAIMGPRAAEVYFTLFDRIPELLAKGCPFHPETLLKATLDAGRISTYEDLKTEFSTLRLNGQVRPPEIAPWDIAHAALRAAA